MLPLPIPGPSALIHLTPQYYSTKYLRTQPRNILPEGTPLQNNGDHELHMRRPEGQDSLDEEDLPETLYVYCMALVQVNWYLF